MKSRPLPAVLAFLSLLAALGRLPLSSADAQTTVRSGTVLGAGKWNFGGALPFDPDAQARLGSALAYVGDLDADGEPELAAGAPRDDQAGTNAGAVWILASDAALPRLPHKLLPGGLRAGDLFGHAVTSLGDVDGDGVCDLAVGAPGDDTGGTNRGAVYVLFLEADGSLRAWQRIASLSGGFRGSLDAGDQFGYAVAGVGDLNGDLVPDLVVGAPGDDDGPLPSTDFGAFWVLFLDRAGKVVAEQKVSQRAGVTAVPSKGLKLKGDDGFGSSLAAIGDLDGDTRNELLVGAIGADTQTTVNSGAVFLVHLAANGTVPRLTRFDATTPALQGLLTGSDAFGTSVAGLGDLDHDGVPDVAVGYERKAQQTHGGAWVLLLTAADGVKAARELDSEELALAVDPSDGFGRGLAAVGVSFHNDVLDPGFEGGLSAASWVGTSTNFGTPLCDAACSAGTGSGPRTGQWCARFGGIAKKEVASLEQRVVVRGDTLSFWLWNSRSSGGTGTHQDHFAVRVDGTPVFQIAEGDPLYTGGYRRVLLDVSAFRDGRRHLLRLEADVTGTQAAGKLGRSDFLVDDLLLLEAPPLGPLELAVGAPLDDDLGPDAGMLWGLSVEGAIRARWSARNGAGGNPMAFTTSSAPALGTTWVGTVARAGRTRTLVLGCAAPLPGLALGIGELLVDPSSLAFVSLVTAPATNPPAALTHSLAVPNDPTLVGLTIATQAYRDTGAAAELLNAIDLTIGF